ncbi:MAG: DUF4212 domain-containing protein [Robiginitomaculum sp.]|nr:DUF4212 domain-containing protein [Robiginitomaculum sp.]
MSNKSRGASPYWKANLKLMGILLSIWALVSFGFGIFLRPFLDQFSVGGAPLGFWFAQQGSIIVFVILIFVYTHFMKKLDAKYGSDEEQNP